jgi:hypothetical protein
MLKEMKRVDETFQEVYRQPHYVGSYYENLRVAHPTEFDINLELQLPISEQYIQVGFISIVPKIKSNNYYERWWWWRRGRRRRLWWWRRWRRRQQLQQFCCAIASINSIVLKLKNKNCYKIIVVAAAVLVVAVAVLSRYVNTRSSFYLTALVCHFPLLV